MIYRFFFSILIRLAHFVMLSFLCFQILPQKLSLPEVSVYEGKFYLNSPWEFTSLSFSFYQFYYTIQWSLCQGYIGFTPSIHRNPSICRRVFIYGTNTTHEGTVWHVPFPGQRSMSHGSFEANTANSKFPFTLPSISSHCFRKWLAPDQVTLLILLLIVWDHCNFEQLKCVLPVGLRAAIPVLFLKKCNLIIIAIHSSPPLASLKSVFAYNWRIMPSTHTIYISTRWSTQDYIHNYNLSDVWGPFYWLRFTLIPA